MKKIEIKQGDRYGKLSIVKELEKQSKRRSFLCKCECGNEKIIQLNQEFYSNTPVKAFLY